MEQFLFLLLVLVKHMLNIPKLNQGIGLMSVGWAIFTTMLVLCVMKSTLSFFWALFTLDLTIILFSGWVLLDSDKVKIAGGIMGVINTFAGWFEAFAGVPTHIIHIWFPKKFPTRSFTLV